jgi:hypothetical protein
MRRFWIVVAGVFAFAGIVSGPGVAYARSDGNLKASSCSDLVKKYQKVNQASTHVDFSNPKAVSTLFKQSVQVLKSLAKSGPSALRSSFKRLASAFDKLSNVDFSNPTALSQISTTFGITVAKDLQKIAAYFAKQCNFNIASAPNTSIPGSSTT